MSLFEKSKKENKGGDEKAQKFYIQMWVTLYYILEIIVIAGPVCVDQPYQ
jgi:hypothetical protein